MGILLEGFRLHCAVMIVLYVCQGLAQGTLQIMVLLLLQDHPELSAADQATLALPMYSFSLKFLWAPLVDHYYRKCGCRDRRRASCVQRSPPCAGYHCAEDSPVKAKPGPTADDSAESAPSPSLAEPGAGSASEPCRTYSFFHRLHRRVQWVVVLELVMGATYAWLCYNGDDAYLEAVVKRRAVFWQLFVVLCVLSFANATQDVAVDAWAVEGLDPAHVSTAGMLQLVGVTTGISIANIFVPLRSRFPDTFTLFGFFALCCGLCLLCAVLAIYLAWRRRLLNEHRLEQEAQQRLKRAADSRAAEEDDINGPILETGGILDTLRQIFATQGLRELVSVYLTRGWPLALFPLVVSRLISMRVVTASAVARFRIYSTFVQVLVAAYLSVPLVRHVKAARIVQYVSGFDFVLNVIAAVCFVAVAVPAVASWFGVVVVLPITVLIFGVGALGFVANVSLQGRFAHLFPRDVGGVLSLLAAISNMGHHLPSTFCLYAASVVVQLCTWYTGQDTTYATYYAAAHRPTDAPEGLLDLFPKRSNTANTATTTRPPTAPLSPYWVKMDVIACAAVFFSIGFVLRYVCLVPAADRLVRIAEEDSAKSAQGGEGDDPSQPLLHV